MPQSPIPIGNIFNAIDQDDQSWGDESRLLICPVCGHNYTHIEPPHFKAGNDNYDADWGGRGDLAVIPARSECGSKWEVCIGFHKGQSAIFTRVINSCKNKAS